MSSAEAQRAYQRGGFMEPVAAQEQFSQQYDLANPEKAMASYQKILHQHTMQQYESATKSSRRRSPNGNELASLSTESSRGSVSSTGS
ncbi:hypothetical protein Tdes44962_MAKER02162 [Teratosphaeria destructans]|uniref:Uncharacterized protein n=1 Tax=Teratosphaeria destructans TaxID=418781 RepID=A0A9W7W3K5_9PEZI|nr:hypothetical protein Tdes44962_MAKER02162 [Teratosphaeria destructans]